MAIKNPDTFVVFLKVAGTLATSTGALRHLVPFDAECVNAEASVGTASVADDVTAAVKVNGASKLTVTVAAGDNATEAPTKITPGVDAGMNYFGNDFPGPVKVFEVVKGDYLTLDVTQVGDNGDDGGQGSDLVVALTFARK